MPKSFSFLLTAALLLSHGLLGCATKTTVSVTYAGSAQDGLPACPGKVPVLDPSYWDNCFGYQLIRMGSDLYSHTEGQFRGGRMVGNIFAWFPQKNEVCTYELRNGVIEGWRICSQREGGQVVSREFFVGGKTSQQLTSNQIDIESRSKCLSYGFKDATSEMGNCILRLRSDSQAMPIQAQRPSDVKPSTSDKLDGAVQMLQGIQGILGGAADLPAKNSDGRQTCSKVSEARSGLYKTCVYRCVGGEVSNTIRAAEVCPQSHRF